MGFDLGHLRRAVEAHGRVARVVIAEVRGSTPRGVGTAMLVWDGGQDGTIGGGALEFAASRDALRSPGVVTHPLGPSLGQCCGGSVTLLTEVYEAADLAALEGRAVIARGPGDMPDAVARLVRQAEAGELVAPRFVQGWMVEPVAAPAAPVWIWGAGHVGRALVSVMAPLPDLSLSWIDTGPERFPDDVPEAVTVLPAADIARLMAHAPQDALHLIVTYSHDLDLALCHAALLRGFRFAGLIGSDTKWARFSRRLKAMGVADPDRITCPIGDKRLGKHPQAIAVSVTAQLLELISKQEVTPWETRSSASAG